MTKLTNEQRIEIHQRRFERENIISLDLNFDTRKSHIIDTNKFLCNDNN